MRIKMMIKKGMHDRNNGQCPMSNEKCRRPDRGWDIEHETALESVVYFE